MKRFSKPKPAPDAAVLSSPVLYVCAFLSGAAALVDETLWTRRLSEVFGHTALALATVAAALMAGLALGSLLSQRLRPLDRTRLRRFFILSELGIGLFGFFSPHWLSIVERASPVAGPGLFAVFIAALWPGVALMGLTLPLLVACASPEGEDRDDAFGGLYGWNTLGGALGCVLAGLVLPPRWGVALSLKAAAFFNFAAAALAARARPAPAVSASPALDPAPNPPGVFLLLAFVGGAAGLACEVAWMRLLELLLGSTVQIVGLTLLCVLAGIGLGGIAYRAARARLMAELGSWAWTQLICAGTLWTGLAGFERLVYLAASALTSPGQTFAGRLAADGAFCAALTLVPSFLMGLSLPWLFSCAERARPRCAIGAFYAANAAGAAAGSLAFAFRLLPALGMEGGLKAVGLIAALAAAGAAILGAAGKKGRASLALAAAALAAAAWPRWIDPQVLTTGVFLYGSEYREAASFVEFRAKAVSAYPLLFYADGLSATVTVKKDAAGERLLQVNGKTDGSSGEDVLTQLAIGYIPLMLRPSAEKALVVGLGTGMTAGALARSPRLRALDIVEIEAEVARAASFFAEENHHVLGDPRARLVVADARHFLRGEGALYDIITAEPSNPWISGIASLYTREHFLSGRRRLAPGGVYAQWFHAYLMSEREFRMVLATFGSVFPHVLLFRAGADRDYLLVGSQDGFARGLAEAERLAREAPAIRADLARFHFDGPTGLLAGSFVLGDAPWRRYAAGAAQNSDDKPLLEFAAPADMLVNETRAIYERLEAFRDEEFPELLADAQTKRPSTREIARAALAAHDPERSARLLRLSRSSGDAEAELAAAGALLKEGRSSDAEEILLALAAARPRDAEPCFHLGDIYVLRGDWEKARAWQERGLALEPDNSRANLSAASVYLRLGRREDAKRALRRALDGKPALNAATREAVLRDLERWR